MYKGLENKVALVTGASSGIGRAASIAFAKQGAKVVLASRNEASTLQTLHMVEEVGGEGIFVKTDVSIADDVENLIQTTLKTYGQLDCAFNNAGVSGPAGPLFQLAESDFQEIMDVNLKGVWLCMKHELTAMLAKGGGSIVNMSSAAGLIGSVGIAAYTASKHGVIGLTKCAALEYAKANIRVNAVCPSVIDNTVMVNQVKAAYPEVYNYLLATHPVGRIGQPEEVANAVVWLCSDVASFITGVAFPIDGGTVAGQIPKAS
ncbi:MAG: short chain dehydrogenase [Chloroflexota bacterium]|nr:SDR family oxidoreductase [Chloroflexota bacterium]NOG62518.1 SDR family oxidoreductase [Chloroflexota bacterium]GIK64212.1 MAG: short chain dehydrogenase [Chloroflexota bacterium]